MRVGQVGWRFVPHQIDPIDLLGLAQSGRGRDGGLLEQRRSW